MIADDVRARATEAAIAASAEVLGAGATRGERVQVLVTAASLVLRRAAGGGDLSVVEARELAHLAAQLMFAELVGSRVMALMTLLSGTPPSESGQ